LSQSSYSTTHTNLEIPRTPHRASSISTPNHQVSLCLSAIYTLIFRAINCDTTPHHTAFPDLPWTRQEIFVTGDWTFLRPSLIIDDPLDTAKYSSSPPAHLQWRVKFSPVLPVNPPVRFPKTRRLSTNMQTKRDARYLFGARSLETSVPCTPSVGFWSTIKSVRECPPGISSSSTDQHLS
jgi:hypothetical protein